VNKPICNTLDVAAELLLLCDSGWETKRSHVFLGGNPPFNDGGMEERRPYRPERGNWRCRGFKKWGGKKKKDAKLAPSP